MAEATSYVRVIFNSSEHAVAEIPLDGKVHTYAGLAETAAIKHLGKGAAAEVPAGALSLRGPVTACSKADALSTLSALTDDAEPSDLIAVSCGSWFLLTIRTTLPPGKFKRQMISYHTRLTLHLFISTRRFGHVCRPRPWCVRMFLLRVSSLFVAHLLDLSLQSLIRGLMGSAQKGMAAHH